MGIERTVQAVAEAARAVITAERAYAAVVVTDADEATALGAYERRATAQGRATREEGEIVADGSWLRGYVAANKSGGGIVVLSGNVVVGSTDGEG